MSQTKPQPKAGEPCPIDGGELKKVAQPTDAERAASKDRDNPVPLRPGVDSATPEQITELGDLYKCASCGYQTRIKPDAGAGAQSGAQTGDRSGTRSAAGAGSQQTGDQARSQGQGQGDQGGASNQADELQRLRDENARLRNPGGAPQ